MEDWEEWEVVEPDPEAMAPTTAEKVKLDEKNKKVKAHLLQCIPDDILMQVAKKKMGKGVWDSLKARFVAWGSLDDAALVKKLFDIVPDHYLTVVAGIEQFYDLKTIAFDEAVGRLKAFEERTVWRGGGARTPTGQVMLTQAEWEARQRSAGGDSSGKGKRGDGGSRGDPTGDVWYLDNGASNHMSIDRQKFRDLNLAINGKVRFGDDSTVDIFGRGTIVFQGKGGDQWVLSDVYYIPKLRSNLVSLGQLTESGHRILLDDDLLEVVDKHSDRLIMKVPRAGNRLYKIELSIAVPKCLMASIDSQAWLWHGRLGHVNFRSLKQLVGKGMATGIPDISHPEQRKLVGYSIVIMVRIYMERRSTGGMTFYLNENLITWCSQKQKTVSLSSCESEFMAATAAAKQALWLRNLISEITKERPKAVTLFVDNNSAIALMKNPVFHGRSKHIDLKYHFIRECIERGQIVVKRVGTEEQKADVLTKSMPAVKLAVMSHLIGVRDLDSTLTKTSALIMYVAGIVKDWLLIAFSWTVIKDTVTPVNLVGYGIAFLSVAYYNHAKLEALKAKEAERKVAATAVAKSDDDAEAGARLLPPGNKDGAGDNGDHKN
ncbi:unnamed protein product [Miscanthus lutarioriparius]|uniref:Uncharacterized protein n=1 Tax=Miscanthus lutarioriparius TaxID=422564 RepID=A0A811REW8_9POAL|nr:unnamed protein product [Miscanthus lutarioriparius]